MAISEAQSETWKGEYVKKYNPHNLPTDKSKVLIDFEPGKKQTWEFVETVAIVNDKNLVPYTMDRIRQDNGKRVYFAGIGQDFKFMYVDEKYTEPANKLGDGGVSSPT